MLPKYFYTDVTKESVEWFNKTYNKQWNFPWVWKYIWFEWDTNKYDNPKDFKNSPTYLTPQQFMKAINQEEFKRWEIVIDMDGDEVEFITDLKQEDDCGYSYVIKYDWNYFFASQITKKRKEQTEIEKAIELLTREWKIKGGKILV